MRSEGELCREWGISRGEMRELSDVHLVAGEHFVDGKTRVITERGLERLREVMGVRESVTEVATPVMEGEFEVVGTPRNKRILMVKDSKGVEIRVWVRSNENFMVGMKVRARQEGAYEDVWNLVGRCPRYRGRW